MCFFGGILFKHLITILILLNISLGFIADASQSKDMHCTQSFADEIRLLDNGLPSNEGEPKKHSEEQCLTQHCHFGHCATIKSNEHFKVIIVKPQGIEFNSNLSPRDFAFNLFRPPISV